MRAKLFYLSLPDIDPIPILAIELRDAWRDRRAFLEEAGYPQGKDDPAQFIALTLLYNEGMNVRHYIWGKTLAEWLPANFDAIVEGSTVSMGVKHGRAGSGHRDYGIGSGEGSGS